jgi:hypothetical protein
MINIKSFLIEQAIQFDLPKVSTKRLAMNYSFNEKQRRIECQASDEAKLLQDQVNSFTQFPWQYEKAILWYTAEVNIYLKLIWII